MTESHMSKQPDNISYNAHMWHDSLGVSISLLKNPWNYFPPTRLNDPNFSFQPRPFKHFGHEGSPLLHKTSLVPLTKRRLLN